MDVGIRRRRDELLREFSAREAPRVLLLFTAIIVVFDVGFAAFGIVMPAHYYASDAVQGLWNLVTAVLIVRGIITPKWAPAAFALAICVDNAMLNFQYTIAGYSAVGVILLTMAVYGAITLVWRPFIISAVWMGALTSYVIVTTDPDQGLGWALTAITALLVSGTVLYGRIKAVERLAIANQRIEEMATRDALTGLLNRHGLDGIQGALASLSRRTGMPLFSVFVDVCGLKVVNDKHGHAAGDDVIRASAAALVATCRESDAICRWGGDEFVVVGLGDAPDPSAFAERLIGRIDASRFAGTWKPDLAVGVSQATDGDIERLISDSDAHMYARREVARR